MNFTINRTIINNIFTTTIAFDSFGALDITADAEQELLKNYPVSVQYKDITFTDKYKLIGKEVAKDATGDSVTLISNEKVIPLTNLFQAKYEVNISQIGSNELGTSLTTPELVCQAKCKLFEDKIQTQIGVLLVLVKSKENTFETVSPITVTI